VEEIRNVTYGLWGSELPEHSAIQRLAKAGFPIWVPSHREIVQPHSPLQIMFAIIEGESGGYLKAWHANVLRDPPFTGDIVRTTDQKMTIRSIDLGFIQRNVDMTDFKVEMTEEAMKAVVDDLFEVKYPQLARADLSAAIAFDLWQDRGFKPWYAYQPGTPRFRVKMFRAAMALGNWLSRSFVGKYDAAGEPAEVFRKLVFLDQYREAQE
jgi:hypothetical protein